MSPYALDRALDALAAESAAPSRIGDVDLPNALARQGLHARRFIGADYWLAPVRRTRLGDWRAYVLRAPAGTKIPPHRHLGQEFFQVLMGSVADDRVHGSGDFVAASAGADHALQVGVEDSCACLIAVEHGAQWRGITRWLSPWLGI